MSEPTTEAGRRKPGEQWVSILTDFLRTDVGLSWDDTNAVLVMVDAIEAEARASLLDDLTLAAGATFAPGAALDSVLAILAAGEDPS